VNVSGRSSSLLSSAPHSQQVFEAFTRASNSV